MNHKVLITTVPFGEIDREPIDLLESNNISYDINPLGRKLTEDDLKEMISEYSILIAGTEPITDAVLQRGEKLELISRVGIGLDSVDLMAARRRGIHVSYTPDAPAPAVSELTIGLMLSLLRKVQRSNVEMHDGEWKRYFGKRLSESTVGIIGLGRIGRRVVHHLSGFGNVRVLVNDIVRDNLFVDQYGMEFVDKEVIYRESDVITLHVPLTSETKDLICADQISVMKDDVVLINTARGGIINEADLADAFSNNTIAGAAIDTFDFEPYSGDLTSYKDCLLTAHMGSMSVDCRSSMEIEATKEAVRYVLGQELLGTVPEYEYIDF